MHSDCTEKIVKICLLFAEDGGFLKAGPHEGVRAAINSYKILYAVADGFPDPDKFVGVWVFISSLSTHHKERIKSGTIRLEEFAKSEHIAVKNSFDP